ncbi:phosphate/phosphite/phosphonate ABC transporter substrate-binding protein [Natroniella sulfidigena]|uniref:phosphate/phosphite/phosphonate ABC transporter substrate-binding protein n=1 Tax=Natroniella sulfidigena TaxID=723921 RepID=UPI00200B5DCC|nr:phosphate/phosphite/phosphonate ABC transporter substrate-binding protein [Natroniella sulfidigena]MCK8816108.1 phosphate/phosphite/phosphonate ABC transporter substrate-binding protein [Natroniella sulfidigena]
MKKRLLTVVLVLSLTLIVVPVARAGFLNWLFGISVGEEEFTIGLIPAQTQGEMAPAIEKLTDHLKVELDKQVQIDTYPDYNGVVEAMNYGQIDMAYFGPLTYVIANQQVGAQAIITQLVDDTPYYYSYIVTHKDSPLDSLNDLIAKADELDVAFGDPSSTSGGLIPNIAFKEDGINIDDAFNSLTYTGSHDATALAVQDQQVDAGAIDSAIFDTLVANEVIDGDKFKVIWRSEKLFQYPWAVSRDVEEELIDQIREAFYKIDNQEVLDAFGASGFTKAVDEDYEPIREAAKEEGRI